MYQKILEMSMNYIPTMTLNPAFTKKDSIPGSKNITPSNTKIPYFERNTFSWFIESGKKVKRI